MFRLLYLCLACLLPLICNASQRKVFDCFMFLNEIDILKVRLNELYDAVDYFVILESRKTFSAQDKPANFLDHRDEFAQFEDKIIYILLEDGVSETDFWANEYYQRNQILQGLVNAKDKDIVILSDLDEIVRSSTVDFIRDYYEGKTKYACIPQAVFYLGLDWYAYKLNAKINRPWWGGNISTVKTIRQYTPQGLRRLACPNIINLENAGWHFTWIGSPEEKLYKLKSFSHAKDPYVKDDETMLNIFETTLDYKYNQQSQDCAILIPLNNSFPKYILDNQDYFIEKGYLDLPEEP